jgi:hypothetical protein
LTGAGSNNVSIQLQVGSSEEEGQIHQLPSIAWLTFLLALSHELPVAAGADMDNCPFFLLYLKKVNQDKGNPFFFGNTDKGNPSYKLFNDIGINLSIYIHAYGL